MTTPMLDFNTFRHTFFNKLLEYSATPSLSRQETFFISKHIVPDFIPRNDKQHFYINAKDGVIESCVLMSDEEVRSNIFFTVHTDRVPGPDGEPCKVILPLAPDKELITAQLDDLVGIILLQILHTQYDNVNILFTTCEEPPYMTSWKFLQDTCDRFREPYQRIFPVSVDIDIFVGIDPAWDFVSIRGEDAFGKMEPSLVAHLREIAKKEKVPRCSDALGWAAVEAGRLFSETLGHYQGASVGIPLKNYHTGTETATWKSVYNCYRLLAAILNTPYEPSL